MNCKAVVLTAFLVAAAFVYTILVSSTTYAIGESTLSLRPGWNQISSPVAAGINISTIENSCTIMPNKNYKLWAWNAQSQNSNVSQSTPPAIGGPDNPNAWINPAKVEPFKGYWIYSAYACNVSLSGTPATFSSLQIYKGWNMISASGTFSAIQGTCAGHITGNWAWSWDASAQAWSHPTILQSGKGYWIYADQNCVLYGASSAIVSTPTFKPLAGTYTSAQTVTISTSTLNATIRYTLNGTTPSITSPVYTAPIKISSNKTIKAKAFKTGMNSSAVASATYRIINTSTTNSLLLKPGWNQISSRVAAGINITTVEKFCTITPYKNQKLMTWNANTQAWTSSTRIEPLKGYWIYSAYQCAVPLSGTPATFSTLQIYNGWNMISAAGTLSAIQGTCAGHITGNWVWNWDIATQKWIHPTTMQLDKGYWIRVDQNCVMGNATAPITPPITPPPLM